MHMPVVARRAKPGDRPRGCWVDEMRETRPIVTPSTSADTRLRSASYDGQAVPPLLEEKIPWTFLGRLGPRKTQIVNFSLKNTNFSLKTNH